VPRAILPEPFSDDERLASLVAPFDPLSPLIGRDDVILASPRLALGAAASSGKVIQPPATAPAPFVEDIATRRAVVATLLSPQTSQRAFREVTARYHVCWFVLSPKDARSFQSRVQAGDLMPAISTPELRVFHLYACAANEPVSPTAA
jgi:hypothetical protein